ncbi:MAG: hypothetical protein JNL49_04810 [Bacteroidia bacterium]|nr:hypothetical protein [Bacteroidia bacterium]
MKTCKCLLIVLLFLSKFCYGQSCKIAGTTAEEYNYIVKGYKVQVESGLDMKKGYSFRDINTVEFGGRKAVFKELIKGESDLRAIMVIFVGKNGLVNYFCIPLGEASNELRNAYYNLVFTSIDNSDAMNFYQYCLTSVLNTYLSK